MPQVELERQLSVPAVPARSAASYILHAIEEQRADWSEFSLYLNFASIGLPDVGYVAIPVNIDHVKEQLEPRHEIGFTLCARRIPKAFPTFVGAIGIDANGPSNAQIWLAGHYDPPLQLIGGFFNQLVAQNSAQKALENMLNELADAVEGRVQQRERANARYRVIFNTGD
jgi:hypothetical protein